MQELTNDIGHGTNTFAAYNTGELCSIPEHHDAVRPSCKFASQLLTGYVSLL